MKNTIIKKIFTATNIIILLLILIYIFDRYLPLPKDYTGFNAWLEDAPATENYIFGNCGGLITNYLGYGKGLTNGTAIYRRFTQIFLHGGLLHLIANCVGLFFIGKLTEKRFGWWLTIILFILIGFLETFITDPIYLMISPKGHEELENAISIGASGGIFGLIGVCLASVFFNIKSFKKIDLATIIVLSVYGVLTTYIVSFGWTTVCHNVSFILGIIIGSLLITPFFIIKKRKNRNNSVIN